MKKSFIAIISLLLALVAWNAQAGGGRQGMGGGPKNVNPSNQSRSGSTDRIRERVRIHQQDPVQSQQGTLQQQREQNRNRIRQFEQVPYRQ